MRCEMALLDSSKVRGASAYIRKSVRLSPSPLSTFSSHLYPHPLTYHFLTFCIFFFDCLNIHASHVELAARNSSGALLT